MTPDLREIIREVHFQKKLRRLYNCTWVLAAFDLLGLYFVTTNADWLGTGVAVCSLLYIQGALRKMRKELVTGS